MAKGKKGKKKGKSKGKRSKAKAMVMAPTVAAGLVKATCAITDPFCPAAMGAKYPDSGSSRTMTLQSRGFVTLTTDANGNAAVALGASTSDAYVIGSVFNNSNGGVTTWASPTGNQYSGLSGLPSNHKWRIVTFGVRARGLLSPMDASGSMGIIMVPASPVTSTLVGFGLDSQMFTQNLRTNMSDVGGLTAVSRGDGISSHLYNDSAVASTATAATSYGWDVPVVYVRGSKASSSALEVEYVLNWEIMFPFGTTYNLFATPAANDNTTLQMASNAVKTAMRPVIKGGVDKLSMVVHQKASNFFGRLLHAGASALGGAIGGALGGPGGALAGGHTAGLLTDAIIELD